MKITNKEIEEVIMAVKILKKDLAATNLLLDMLDKHHEDDVKPILENAVKIMQDIEEDD